MKAAPPSSGLRAIVVTSLVIASGCSSASPTLDDYPLCSPHARWDRADLSVRGRHANRRIHRGGTLYATAGLVMVSES